MKKNGGEGLSLSRRYSRLGRHLGDHALVVFSVLWRERHFEELGPIFGGGHCLVCPGHFGGVYLDHKAVLDPEFDELE